MARDRPFADWFLDRFAFVLAAVSTTVLVLLLFDLPRTATATTLEEVGVTLLTAVTLVFALLASGVSRPVFSVAVLAGVLFAGWALISWAAGSNSVGFLRWFWFLLVVATPFIVLRRLVAHRVVTNETLIGAASVYLLIAVAFMFLFLAIDSVQAEYFFGEPEPTTGFMYFALVTITTLGYGDLTPATETARAVAVATAIVGQVYLVFIVARMVALYTRTARGDGGAST